MRPHAAVDRTFFLTLVLVLLGATAWAQLPTATLNGTVTDPQGSAVPGARVLVVSQATGATREALAGTEGQYIVANLAPGLYTVRVEARGFASKEHRDIRLEVGRSVTLDVSVSLERLAEVVKVEGGAAQIELTQSQVQGMITAGTIETIPLNGRNFLELAFLLPGNRPASNYDPTKTNSLEVSSAGAFGRGGNITVDGGDNNDEVVGGTLMNLPQDSVQEFQIATNRFTAEVGRSGSSIINIITKSGANALHGSAFVFFRHKELQGLPATFDRTQPTPPFDREQFGGSLGGPFRKDRSWWFFSVEDRNQDAAVEVGQRVNQAIPVPVGGAAPTASDPRRIIRTGAGAPLDEFLLASRVDFKVGANDTLTGRYAFNRSLEVANGSLRKPLGSAANRQSSLNRFNSALFDWTRTAGPRRVNSLIFHVNTFLNSIPAFSPNTSSTVPAGLLPGNEIRFATLQDGANFRIPQRTRFNRYQLRDTFSWVIGAHNLRFGGEWQAQRSDALFDLFGSGSIFLTEDFASADRDRNGVVDDRDIPIAVVVRSVAPIRPPFVPDIDNHYLGFFVQDDWRLRSNFSVNLGLRWEFDSDVLGVSGAHRPCASIPAPPQDPCVWITPLLNLKRDRDINNLGPRLGFAWDPFRKGRTVIRGGYGVYYDRIVLEVRLLELLLDGRLLPLQVLGGSQCIGPGGAVSDAFCTGTNPFAPGTPTLADPFTGSPSPLPIGINFIDNQTATPYVQQFSLGLQHQVGNDWLVSADAVHNFGQRLLIGRLVGTIPNPHFPGSPSDNLVSIEPSAKSWFDGLLVSLQKRPTKTGWLQWGFNVNYTLSKAFSYANDDQIPFNIEQQVDPTNLRLEKGPAPTDERQRFVFYGSLGFPWEITVSPIWTLASDVPMDLFVPALNSRLPNVSRNAGGRSVRTCSDVNRAIDAWNASGPPRGSALPPVTCSGTLGDSFNSFDVRFSKALRFAERHKVELIAETFNLFNVTNVRGFNNNNFSGFNNALTSSGFGQPERVAGGFFGAGGPRAFQFALRYSF